MNKDELIAVLRHLDQHLSSSYEVVLVGGAAMILHFGANRVTRDVDALLLQGDPVELRTALTFVSEAHNLPNDWMSDAVKGFADVLPPDFRQRLVPLDLKLKQLRLYVLGRAEQVTLKVVALREQDLEDLELLLPKMSEADKQLLVRIMNHVATFRPDWAQKIRYFLLEQGWPTE